MKLIANIDGNETELNIRREGNAVYAEIEGRRYEVEASVPEPGVYLLKCGKIIFEVAVSENDTNSTSYQIRLDSAEYGVSIRDPKYLRGTGVELGSADGIVEIRTQMPGKVVRLLVKPGDSVTAGQGVIVVEAMKMQNEMKSPKDGVVKEMKFSVNDTVNAGDVLLVIE